MNIQQQIRRLRSLCKQSDWQGRSLVFEAFLTNDSGLPYPEWQIPVRDAILETDRERFPQRVPEAEVKISERFQQIGLSTGGRHEQEALNHALSLMTALKKERLAG